MNGFRSSAALLLAGALIGASPARAAGDGVLDRGFGAPPNALDPHLNFGAREAWIQGFYEGLIALNLSIPLHPDAERVHHAKGWMK
jgi:hypothetical protein